MNKKQGNLLIHGPCVTPQGHKHLMCQLSKHPEPKTEGETPPSVRVYIIHTNIKILSSENKYLPGIFLSDQAEQGDREEPLHGPDGDEEAGCGPGLSAEARCYRRGH